MDKLVIDRATFADQVLGCWLGKNIGGTLGTPHECKRYVLNLSFYDPVPTKALPNDDLDLQLVWLKMLEETGTDPSVRTFAEYWSRYGRCFPWNEYGFFMRNFARGLRPPVAGAFENYFVDEMGSPIRSEIWAVLHAGDPQAAARMAWKDSAVDHAGGEGTYGEMFWAAAEAAAFVERDPLTLIRIGLSMIPLSCHISRAIREAVWCWENRVPWGDARERIASRFGHLQPCNAIPNHAFTVVGWLYGQDFGDRLVKAVNCGFDTDCTGATLGSILGIIEGAARIPKRWSDPVGHNIVVHQLTRGFTPPATIEELTTRSIKLAEAIAAKSEERAFGSTTTRPADLATRLVRNRLAVEALAQDVNMGVELAGKTEIALHYGGEPVLRPGLGREMAVTVDGRPAADAKLSVPAGWACAELGGGRFRLACDGAVAARNQVTVSVAGGKVAFTVLGPDEAKGYPAGANVPSCPGCGARVEECFCVEIGKKPPAR
jgi:ADP-ribosylglycohydrolase